MTATPPPDLSPWDKRPPYIQRWVDKRNGAERFYFRKGGAPATELKQPWGTKAMAAEVAALTKAARARPAPIAGTVTGAIRAYRGDQKSTPKLDPSPAYAQLSLSTRIAYDRWLDEFETSFAGVLLEDIDAAFVLEVQKKWVKRGYEAANKGLQVLINVCQAPRIQGLIAGNPFELIDKVKRPHGQKVRNPAPENAEVEALIERAIAKRQPGLGRAIALGRYGGFRKQTVCRVPRSARIRRPTRSGEIERRIYWETEKKQVLCDRREDPRLTALLARTEGKAGKVEPLTLAFNRYGQRFKERALLQAFDRLAAELAAEGLVRGFIDDKGQWWSILTFHGLRHGRGLELAYAGASDAEIMAQLDHATAAAAKEYRKQAERLRLADAAQDRVDAEIAVLDAAREKRRQSGEA